MPTRRDFIDTAMTTAAALLVGPAFQSTPSIQLSLAEWSLHRSIKEGKLDHLDFPSVASKRYGISAVEYVNGCFGSYKRDFKEAGQDQSYLRDLLKRSRDAGVVNHLIMVDDEGPLALPSDKERLAAVDNHKKWLDAAKYLGFQTIRVNLHGEGDTSEKKNASIDSLSRLGELARPMGLNIVVENHGSDSSKGWWLAEIMKAVNKTNVGTLPDFGNFCISHPWGTTEGECDEYYDRYKGIEEMLPFAKGVSAKSYDFDPDGSQPKIDYKRLISLLKSSGFKGHLGIEFEGANQPEDEGIRKTRSLIEKYL
jgi:sugar phosphate isomerase/epimerase